MTSLAFPPIPAVLDDDSRLAEQITLLAGQINAANHRLLTLIAEFDSRKAWSGPGEGAGGTCPDHTAVDRRRLRRR